MVNQQMNSQLRKGALELCVLSLLMKRDCYGYELTDSISKEMEIVPGTLYLILKRLKNEGLVETYLVESSDGPARKYYHLTECGKSAQRNMLAQWRSFTHSVARLIEEK